MKNLMFAFAVMFSFSATALNWGVGTDWKTLSQDLPILKARNLKTIRVNAAFDIDRAQFRSAMTLARANGIRPTAIFFTSFQWDSNCNQDLTAVEAKAYAQTYAVINDLKDVVYDWEMQNENDLSTTCPMKGAGLGRNASDYENPNSHLHAAVLHGISRAIGDIKTQSKLPLRRILGFTTFHTGFVDFMLNNGVQFEVIGYHYYELQGKTPYNGNWDTVNPMNAGWNIFAALARYNRPIHINEFNAAEIYSAGYYNVAGDALSEKGYKGFKEQLEFWRTANATVKQKYGATINLETVMAYCMYDAPSKGNPTSGLAKDAESRFGMMFGSSQPKVSMLLLSAYAGGSLTESERLSIINRGLLTSAQIDSFKPAPPAPSLLFNGAMIYKNRQPMTLSPVVTSAPSSWQCQGILLPSGLTMNYDSCVISGTSNVTIPASGSSVSTVTVVIGALSKVQVFNITVVP